MKAEIASHIPACAAKGERDPIALKMARAHRAAGMRRRIWIWLFEKLRTRCGRAALHCTAMRPISQGQQCCRFPHSKLKYFHSNSAKVRG
jgi:hypothetical protein